MARAMPSAADAANSWKTGFGGAGQRWVAGVNSVQEAPGVLAAAAQDRYLQGIQQNVGKFAANVAKVTRAEWQASCQSAQGNLAAGANKGQAKYQAKIGPVLQTISQLRDSLPPRGDIMTNLQRAQQLALGLHEAAQRGF